MTRIEIKIPNGKAGGDSSLPAFPVWPIRSALPIAAGGGRIGARLAPGQQGMVVAERRLFGIGDTEDDRKYGQALLQAQQATNPIVRPDDSWLSKNLIKAARGAVPLIQSVEYSAIGGGRPAGGKLATVAAEMERREAELKLVENDSQAPPRGGCDSIPGIRLAVR